MSDPAPANHPPLRRRATLSGLEKLKVSAVILVNHDAPHLERVLTAVGFCDDVLVVAASASASVQEVCVAVRVPITSLPTEGPGSSAERAVGLAKHDWVLFLAGDEVLDYEAATTIQVLDYSDPLRSWRIRRRLYVGAREIRFGEWVADHQVRLFNRRQVHLTGGLDEDVAVTATATSAPSPRTLEGSLHRYHFNDYADLLTGTIQQARTRALAHDGASRIGAVSLLVRSGWAFVRSFIVRQGFRDGVAGLVIGVAVVIDTMLAPSLRHEREGGSTGL
jgi:hypothetical protein